MNSARPVLIAVMALAVSAAACDRDKSPKQKTKAEKPECKPNIACPDGSEVKKEQKCGEYGECTEKESCGEKFTCIAKYPEPWPAEIHRKLTTAQQGQVKRATAARDQLSQTLVGALKKSIDERGYAESLAFCRGEAPTITQQVGKEQGVEIGRTSHKLRNPANKPPHWARFAVKEKARKEMYYLGPEGQLGVVSPIRTIGLCVNCHGPKENLAEGVPEALTKLYPEDEATGFKDGDIRGWFWVEVPGS